MVLDKFCWVVGHQHMSQEVAAVQGLGSAEQEPQLLPAWELPAAAGHKHADHLVGLSKLISRAL